MIHISKHYIRIFKIAYAVDLEWLIIAVILAEAVLKLDVIPSVKTDGNEEKRMKEHLTPCHYVKSFVKLHQKRKRFVEIKRAKF